jgi:hypothetical protein
MAPSGPTRFLLETQAKAPAKAWAMLSCPFGASESRCHPKSENATLSFYFKAKFILRLLGVLIGATARFSNRPRSRRRPRDRSLSF